MSWKELLGFKPTPKDLALALIQRAPAPRQGGWHYDGEQNQIRGDHGVTINLGNIHSEYVRAPRRARAALLAKYVSMMQPEEPVIPKLWSLARQRLYVVVRSRYDLIPSIPDTQRSPSIQLPWVGELCLRLVYDLGPSLMLVGRDLLDEWGQSEDAVREQGLRNLTSLQTPRWEAVAEDVYQLASEVSYEESLLLVERVVERLPIRGPAVFLPVNRGVLLACDGSSAASLAAMLDTARRALVEAPWPLGATLLHKIEGAWQEFPVFGHAARKLRAVEKISLAQVYDSQKHMLDRFHEQQQDDVFVASFQLWQAKGDSDSLQSFATWSQGVRTLLPKTDFIAFVRRLDQPEPESTHVPWEQALAVCSHHMHATDWDPPRLRVEGFPSEDEWQRLQVLSRQPTPP